MRCRLLRFYAGYQCGPHPRFYVGSDKVAARTGIAYNKKRRK